jgi:hypothetical protein
MKINFVKELYEIEMHDENIISQQNKLTGRLQKSGKDSIMPHSIT